MTLESEALGSRPREKVERRHKGAVLTVLSLLGLLALGVGGYLYATLRRSTNDAQLEAHVVNLAPRVPGQVLRVLVQENQVVKKGQLLIELDPGDYQVRVAQAKAALQGAERRRQAAQVRASVARTTTEASLRGARSSLDMGGANLRRAQVQVSTAQSARDANRARVDVARAQERTAALALNELKSLARSAEVQLEKSRQDLERARQLVELEASPDEVLDHAQAAFDAAEANLQAARDKIAAGDSRVAESHAAMLAADGLLAQSESQVAESQAHVGEVAAAREDHASKVDSALSAPLQVQAAQLEEEIARAEVAAAKASLKKAELDLSYTRIVAPMDGRVSRRLVEPGSFVAAGQSAMAEVSEQVWVIANFRETDLRYLAPKQPASVEIDAYPGQTFAAHVDSIQPGTGSRFALLPPENASGNWVKVVQRVPVKLTFDQQPEERFHLEPGMSVHVSLR